MGLFFNDELSARDNLAERIAIAEIEKQDRIISKREATLKQNKQFEKNNPFTAKTRKFTQQVTAQSNRVAAFANANAQRAVGQADEFAGEARRQQVSFSPEQQALQQMFGGGDKIWGTYMQPVTINNDLNPSRSDFRDETAGMFGAGPHGERSGLF